MGTLDNSALKKLFQKAQTVSSDWKWTDDQNIILGSDSDFHIFYNDATGKLIITDGVNTLLALTDTGLVATLEIDKISTLTGINSVLNAELAQLETIGATTLSALQWGYLGAMDQGVTTALLTTLIESIITAKIVGGQSIDNAIDSLIATHKAIAGDHHAKYTTAEVETVITAELVNGQSIDLAIDSLIATHKGLASDHHSKWTTANTETVITAKLVNGQSIDLAIDSLIATHKALASDHHAKYALTDDLASGEISQLQNIGAQTISLAQWTLLGALAGTLSATELNYVDGVTRAIQTQLDEMAFIGAANAIWVNMGEPNIQTSNEWEVEAKILSSLGWYNMGATNFTLSFTLEMPLQKVHNGATVNLYVSGTRVSIKAADANDKLSNIRVKGLNDSGETGLDTGTPNHATAGIKTDTFAGVQAGNIYNRVLMTIDYDVTDASGLQVNSAELQIYYA